MHYKQEAKLAIVRVILPNGHSFLATLCPEAIPYHDVQRGVSHKKYLEIDNSFARELGLSKQGLEVCGGGNTTRCMCVFSAMAFHFHLLDFLLSGFHRDWDGCGSVHTTHDCSKVPR